MANKFTDAVIDFEALNPPEKAALVVLAMRSNNETGQAWPSVGHIVRLSRFQRTAIKDALKNLVDMKIIKKVGEHPTQRGPVPVYRIAENILNREWRAEVEMDAEAWRTKMLAEAKARAKMLADAEAQRNKVEVEAEAKGEAGDDSLEKDGNPNGVAMATLWRPYGDPIGGHQVARRPGTRSSDGPLPGRETAGHQVARRPENSSLNSSLELFILNSSSISEQNLLPEQTSKANPEPQATPESEHTVDAMYKAEAEAEITRKKELAKFLAAQAQAEFESEPASADRF
jgi:hypothetical protein